MHAASGLLLAIALVGCHHASPATTPSPDDHTTSVAAQIARGKTLYVERCAKCHGDAGAAAFPLAPRAGAKRDVEFHTAADVFAWASKNMPGDAPGMLAPDELLAIFAFDLTANKVTLAAPLDGPAAQAIVLHP